VSESPIWIRYYSGRPAVCRTHGASAADGSCGNRISIGGRNRASNAAASTKAQPRRFKARQAESSC